MKKIFIPLVVIAVIIPQVALASWWNPFSWSIFHTEPSKTELLENRVKELESKLNEPTAVTPDIPTQKLISNSSKEVIKPISSDPAKVSSKDMIDTIDSMLSNTESEMDDLNTYIATLNYYSNWASKGKNLYMELRDTEHDSYLLEMDNYFIDLFDRFIKYTDVLKNGRPASGPASGPYHSVAALVETINKRLIGLKKIKNSTPTYFDSKEIFTAEFNKLIDYNSKERRAFLDQSYEATMDYLSLVERRMDLVSEGTADIKSYLSEKRLSASRYTSPVIYQPSIVPQLQIPKTTYCTLSGDGGVGLQAHMSCSTY